VTSVSPPESFVIFFPRRYMPLSRRGITPRSASFSPPLIVCVFPVPVTPYAKIVTSRPWKSDFKWGATTHNQLCDWRTAIHHTFIGKELLLRGVHVINAIERETKFLCLVLGIGYPHNVHYLPITAAFCAHNRVFIQLLVKEWSDSSYHCKPVSAVHGAHCEWQRYLPRTDIAGQLGDIRKGKR
jgi:hypothetical protein